MGERQYFSLVANRIIALKGELERAEIELTAAKEENNNKKVNIIEMKKRFLNYKIHYLEKIKDLPFYIVVNELSSEQLRSIRNSIGKLGLSLEETIDYLMEKLKLQEIPTLIKHSDLSCLEQIDDYETIINLITIQKRNGNYEQHKRDLQRELLIPTELCYPVTYQVYEMSGKTRPLCYYEIDHIKKRVAAYRAKLEQMMQIFHSNYSIEQIEEIAFYLDHWVENGLSRKFIETHMERVISGFPEERASIKYLRQLGEKKSFFGAFSAKRKQAKEQHFLDAVVKSYRKDDVLSFFGIENANLFALSKRELSGVIAKIEEMAKIKMAKIEILDQSIRIKQNEILNTARDYNLLQSNAKDQFSKIIYSEIKDFQNAWLHWLWQVPDLLEVFMKGHALAEVETLVECLKNPFPYYREEELIKQIVYSLNPKKS